MRMIKLFQNKTKVMAIPVLITFIFTFLIISNCFPQVKEVEDGEVWTQATASAGFSKRYGHTSVVFDNKIWVIGGYCNTGPLNDVWSSPNGVTWTQAITSAEFSARSSHTSVVFDNKMWVIGGFGSGVLKDVWSSSDGVEWTQATASAEFPQDPVTRV